jgi:DNA-binding transcriptional regulator YdaS (Cro superfamily)
VNTHHEPLKRAIDICGSQKALADRIGKRQGHVWFWLNKARRIPIEDAVKIEHATEGKVSRQELCPEETALLTGAA